MTLDENGLVVLWERIRGFVAWYFINHFPVANMSRVGGVKPDGETIVVDVDGTMHGTSQTPIATVDTPGKVKPDGETITIDDDGTIHGSSNYELPVASELSLGGVKISSWSYITMDSDDYIDVYASRYKSSDIDKWTKDEYSGTILYPGGAEPLMSFSPENLKRLWQNIKEYVQNNAGSTQDIDYATSNTAGIIKVGEGLTIDENGVLSVDMSMFTPTSSVTTSFYSIYDTTTYSVASSAYSGDEYLTAATFTLASTVGASAFQSCVALSTVSMPTCVSVGSCAFSSCESLVMASLPACTKLGSYAFAYCTSLSSVNLRSCGTVSGYAFSGCTSLSVVDLPICTSVGGAAFWDCATLGSVSLPLCETVGNYAFYECVALSSIALPKCMSIGGGAFSGCTSLMTLDLTSVSAVPTLGSLAFLYTPMRDSTLTGSYGSIYVPTSLYSAFVTAPNWSNVASRIATPDGIPQDENSVWVDNDVMEAINSAIKTKTGQTGDYDTSEMPDAILGITFSETVGSKTVTENGTYRASDDSLDGYSSVTVSVQSGQTNPEPTSDPVPNPNPDPITVPAVNLPYSDPSDILSEATLDNYSTLIEYDDSEYWGNSDNSDYNYKLHDGAHEYDSAEGAVALYPRSHNVPNGMVLEHYNESGLATNGFTVYAVVRPINPMSDAVIASTASSYDVAAPYHKDGIVLAGGNKVSVYVGSTGEETSISTKDGYFVMAIAGAGTSGKVFLLDHDAHGVVVSKTTDGFGGGFDLSARGATTSFTTDDPSGMCDVFVRYIALVRGQESDSVILQNLTNLMETYLVNDGAPIYLPQTRRGSIRVSCPYYTYDTSTHEWESICPPTYSTNLQDGTTSIVSMPVTAEIPSLVNLRSDGLYAVGGDSVAALKCVLGDGMSWGVFYVVMKYVEDGGSSTARKSGMSVIQASSDYVMANVFFESNGWYCPGNGGTGTQRLYGSSSSDGYLEFAIVFTRKYGTSSTDSVIKYYTRESSSPMSTCDISGISASEVRLATNCGCAYKYLGVSSDMEDDATIVENLNKLHSTLVTGSL